MNQKTLINKFSRGATKGTASSLFIEDDTLYSYGHHFPLLIRMPWGYLQNGDKYSITTSCHQSMCRHIATCIIPFSALRAARIEPDRLELIDKAEARYDLRSYVNKDGEKKTITERRPEAVLLKAGDNFFLSSMDRENYFLTQLPHAAKTVAQAFEILRPEGVTGVEGVDYLRQGEWFFTPVKNSLFAPFKIKPAGKGSHFEGGIIFRERVVDRALPSHNMTPHHYATEYGRIQNRDIPDNIAIVRGTVRHTEGDHPMLKLGNGKDWYIAQESNHVRSYGAANKID